MPLAVKNEIFDDPALKFFVKSIQTAMFKYVRL